MKQFKTAVQILSLFVFAVCIVYLSRYFYGNHTAQSHIVQLRRTVSDNSSKKEQYAENGMLSDYYDLYVKNNDMVGWIKIDDTNIDYPVMYNNTDNEYYLHKDFEKEYRYSGLPFMDKDCNLAIPTDNLIIYGHNMKNGTMFAQLLKYENENFLKEHKKIKFDTLYKRGVYDIISVFRTQIGSEHEFKYYNFINSHSEADFENYVDAVKHLSLHAIDESAEFGDKLLTLSTCSYNRKNERFVVVARKITG